jgi:hypothetical protein
MMRLGRGGPNERMCLEEGQVARPSSLLDQSTLPSTKEVQRLLRPCARVLRVWESGEDADIVRYTPSNNNFQ